MKLALRPSSTYLPKPMKRLGFLLVAVSSLSFGAELTRVASSFEDGDPFGMFLMLTFDRVQEQAAITREHYQSNDLLDVTELRYKKIQTNLGIDAHIGIYKDLELHVGVPIVFQQDRHWQYAAGTDATNSTMNHNYTCSPDGTTTCGAPGSGSGELFPGANFDPRGAGVNSYRAGLGDFTFGIAWNAFVQKKDPSKPNWTLRFDYTAPTATLLDPSAPTSTSSRGGIGEKLHKYTFSTAVSKRLGKYLEPYFGLSYTLPWRGPGFYSNCNTPDATKLSHPANCGLDGWKRADTGLQPQHTGGATFGLEVTAFEDVAKHARFGFDFRGWFNYVSEGRVYNEMSDLFGKLLYTSDYGQMGAQIGLTGSAAEFINFRAYTSLAYNTEHFLTNEDIGKDLNGNNLVDVDTAPYEINPNYDFRVDRSGRRFRIEQQYIFRIQVTVSFNF